SHIDKTYDGPEVEAKDRIIASTWNLVDRSLTSAEFSSLCGIVPYTVETKYSVELADEKVMSFGLTNAPESKKDHDEHLKLILELLKKEESYYNDAEGEGTDIAKKSQENGQNRTKTDTGKEREYKSWENAIKSQPLVRSPDTIHDRGVQSLSLSPQGWDVAKTKVVTWDDPLCFKLVILSGDVKHSTDIAKKSQENGQNRTNTDTGKEREYKSRENAIKGQQKSTLGQY
ncbi:hypothetical protein Tco_1036011, partial [Tanacetum coccineum]